MREIKFRGRRIDNGEWVYGDLLLNNGSPIIVIQVKRNYIGYTDVQDGHHWYIETPAYRVDLNTVGQFTGLLDKHGKEIYKGDIVSYKLPYRTTQTHTGDNIPNGSYTEPMEPGIKERGGNIVFNDGMFKIEGDENNSSPYPLCWSINEWDEATIKEAISWSKEDADFFDDPEEGDLQYLLQTYKLKDLQELIKYLSGVEIIGSIHD